MTKVAVASLALLVAAPAAAKEKAPPPEQPAVEPDWGQVRREAEANLKASLFDPGSAQIQWTRGFRWGYYKPILQRKVWGWTACGLINAKNRMGGYVGVTSFIVVYDGGVRIVDLGTNKYSLTEAVCAKSDFPPPQAALLDMPGSASAGAGSLADELGKLADLKARGVLTPAEFDEQKAKLLGR